jgi:quinol monooxygenase YgiN
MYGMCGKLVSQPGQRDKFIEILLNAAQVVGQLPGCHLYVINKDLADEVGIWVMEIWDDKDAHDSSLKNEQVRSLIAEAMPLMAGAPDGAALNVVGGYGI